MKKEGTLWVLAICFTTLIYSSCGGHDPKLDPVLKRSKSVCLSVNQSYPQLDQPKEYPLAEVMGDVLEEAGIEAYIQHGPCDVEVSMDFEFTALSEDYSVKENQFTFAGEIAECFTGTEYHATVKYGDRERGFSRRNPPPTGTIYSCPTLEMAEFFTIAYEAAVTALVAGWEDKDLTILDAALSHEDPDMRVAAAKYFFGRSHILGREESGKLLLLHLMMVEDDSRFTEAILDSFESMYPGQIDPADDPSSFPRFICDHADWFEDLGEEEYEALLADCQGLQ